MTKSKTLSLTVSVLFGLFACPIFGVAQAKPILHPAPVFDKSRFVPQSDLYGGEKAYALTVFHGTKIERFNLRILGVLQKVNSGKDLILIKVTSGPSLTRGVNIAAGMSGSPVYIGKRMVGAIAYSLPFAKEPIGLVTPIGDMLDAWDPDLPTHPNLTLTSSFALPYRRNVVVGDSALDQLTGGRITDRSSEPAWSADSTTTFEPVMTPVMVSGMSADGIARLASVLSPFRLMPMAGGGAPTCLTPAQKAVSLTPGSAVGVSLVQGDIDLTAIGTLTYRDKDKVIAFGHPFTGIGPVDAALTTASITDVFPSYEDLTKLGSPLQTVGRIFQDRPFSVGGVIGQMPHMVPVTIHITDQSDHRTVLFHARVINHPLLTGSLVLQVAQQAIMQTHGTPGDAVAYVNTDVDAQQLGHIVRNNVYYDPLAIEQSATSDLDSVVHLLSSNPFYPLGIKSVSMNVRIESRHDTAQIDHIFIPKTTYQPGETVNVGIVIRPFQKEPVVQTAQLVIPSTTPDGTVTISVRGGGASAGSAISLGGGTILIRPTAPTGPPASNVSQLVHQYLEQPANDDLVSSLLLPTTAITVHGESLAVLPPTMSSVMRSARSSGLHLQRDEVKETTRTGWVLSGQQTLSITVARVSGVESTTTADAASSSDTDAATPDDGSTTDTSLPGMTLASTDSASSDEDSSGAPSVKPNGQLQILPSATGKTIHITDSTLAKDSKDSAESADTDGNDTTGDDTSDSDTSGSDDTAGSDSAKSPKPVGHVARVWRQQSAADFGQGVLHNVSITSDDDVRLALSLEQVASTTSSTIWCIACDKSGGLYAGSGDDGVVYKLAAGKLIPFFRSGELEVTSLAYDPSTGNLYAGTAPHGALFRISPSGRGAKVFSAREKYITALAMGSRGALYLATGGGSGKIYEVPLRSPGRATVLFTSSSSHLLCLALDRQGSIYAGGAPDGLIYRISPSGAAQVFYNATQPDIASLAVDHNGVVYAGTAPSGTVYRLIPSTGSAPPDVKRLGIKSGDAILALAVDGASNVWACSGQTLYCVHPPAQTTDTPTILSYSPANDASFVSLHVEPDDKVWAGTSNIGTLYQLVRGGTQVPLTSSSVPGTTSQDLDAPAQGDTYAGVYVSPIHDSGWTSHWGTISWEPETANRASVELETRSGDVATPDSTWSSWSVAYSDSSGEQIASPPARFIQYRAILRGEPNGDNDAGAALKLVNIYYVPRNRAPSVSVTSPDGGAVVSGKALLKWSGSDPDKDTLSYDVWYSSDGSNTWTKVQAAQQIDSTVDGDAATKPLPGTAKSKKPIHQAGSPSTLSQLASSLSDHPEIPDAVKEQILKQAPEMDKLSAHETGASADASSATNSSLSASSMHWNTAGIPDGEYRIKVVASDAPSNPVDARTAWAISPPFLVVNTSPTLTLKTTALDIASKTVTIHGSAKTHLCYVQSVQYKLDNQASWLPAAADDGLFNSTDEPFTIVTATLPSGPHTITVIAIDQAGNTTTTTEHAVIP